MADVVLIDPLGDEVWLHERTWHGHIARRRPEMRPYRGAVEAIVRAPMVVLRSRNEGDHPTGRVYLGRCPDRNLMIRVCVESAVVAGQPLLMVKTAYLCRTSGHGEQLWP